MSFFEKTYHNAPVFIQNYLISLYGYKLKNKRYGKLFETKCNEFKKRESYTKQQFRDYQTIELRKLLIHAFNTVPYYNESYKKHGFNTSKFKTFEIESLSKLPFLEKEDLRKFGTTKLLSTKKHKGSFISTSGSTGTPTKIFYSNQFYTTWAAAYEMRVREWAGVNYKMKRGMIGGKNILKNVNSKPPFYRYNSAEKQTYFSAYHISEKNIANYVKGIIDNNVEYMVGYALSNFFLADFIVKNNIKVPKLKAVLTSSEKLTNNMRKTFYKAYGCKTFDAYSGVEACGLISENMAGDFLWSPDVGIAEVLDKNAKPVLNGELISTGLLNLDQPLIRYRIGDSVKLSNNQTTNSGLNMLAVDAINGRVEDVIVTKDGRKIISLYRLFLDIPNVKMAQVVQYSFTKFAINIVVDKAFSEKEENSIKNRFFTKVDSNVNLTINKVDKIEKSKTGKYKLTISHL